MTVSIRERAQRYLAAWNAHDADAIVPTFAAHGAHCAPTTVALGDAIGANARRPRSAFPGLTFEIASVTEAGAGRVVAEWTMKRADDRGIPGVAAKWRTPPCSRRMDRA